MNIIGQNIKRISDLCKKHKVSKLYAFGSVLTNHFKDDSDIDLIVDFTTLDAFDYTENYFNLKFSLEDLLKRPIDLLEERSIKNPYFKAHVNQEKQLIYG